MVERTSIKLLRHPVFLLCCAVFIIHQIMQKVLHIAYPVADSYVDNFVAMPIILTLLVVERRFLFKKGESYRLTLQEVIIATLFIAFMVEVVFPLFSDRFTRDWIDFLFYGFGSILFYWTINRRNHFSPEDK